MTNKIKSICIQGGMGRMGGFHVKRLEQEHPSLNIEICDAKQEMEMPDCDAYIVATPSETHYEVAKRLLENQKHVLVEKPLTMNFLEANKLYELAKTNNVTLLPGHTQRYNPAFTSKENLLKRGQTIDFVMYVPHKSDPKNLVFDLMIHEIELALYLVGGGGSIGMLQVEQKENQVDATVLIEETKCRFSVAYHSEQDVRSIENKHVYCDLHVPGKSGQDALYYLHNRFLNLCETGETPDDVKYAVGAVGLAEIIQERIYGGR